MPDKFITLTQLTKAVKGLVNKINGEILIEDSKMGDLANLTTTAKSNLVAAINEAATTGSGSSISPYTSTPAALGTAAAGSSNDYARGDHVHAMPTASDVGAMSTSHAANAITSTDISNWNAKSDFSGSYNDLTNKPTIPAAQVQSDWSATSGMGEILNKPTIPADISDLTDTNRVIPTVPETVSSFQNDAGYLTSFTETDPTVPSWAKAVSKPTYTASEVGALPDTTTYVSSFNGSTGAITYSAPVSSVNGDTGAVVVSKVKTTAASANTEYTLIGTANTNANTSAVTTYQQDLLSFAKTSSLSRLTIGSTSTPGTIRLYSSASSASGFSEIKSNASSTNERTITLPDASGTVALTTDIPSISSWALASSKPSYTFSELTTTPTTLQGYGITDAYTKTEVDGLVSGVLHYKGTKATVSALPSSGNAVGDVWHVTADSGEYAWDGSTWQELGSTVDLSGYVPTSTTVNGKALTGNISLTASDVSALPSNTTYVSFFNGSTGAITYTAPVTSVNGQTGAVTLSIPSATTVTNTLGSGTLIATINGTNIYAPAYTDADGVSY